MNAKLVINKLSWRTWLFWQVISWKITHVRNDNLKPSAIIPSNLFSNFSNWIQSFQSKIRLCYLSEAILRLKLLKKVNKHFTSQKRLLLTIVMKKLRLSFQSLMKADRIKNNIREKLFCGTLRYFSSLSSFYLILARSWWQR